MISTFPRVRRLRRDSQQITPLLLGLRPVLARRDRLGLPDRPHRLG
jgi:hypothetical protein